MPPISPLLSAAQLANLASLGEERTAEVGDVLYRVGDERYPFIAILEGEAAILDSAGDEIVRHGASGFLGELNLMTGQTVYLTAVVTQPMRYIAVEREVLRPLLFDDGPLGDVLLVGLHRAPRGAAAAPGHRRRGHRPAVLGRDARDGRLPAARAPALHVARPRAQRGRRGAGADRRRSRRRSCRSSASPAGPSCARPAAARSGARSGSGPSSARARRSTSSWSAAARRGLGAAVYGASEGLDTLVIESTVLGGQAGFSRRIENYLGFPAGISGGELTTRAVTQARKFGARMATPYRALALEPGGDRHIVRLDGGEEIAARAVVLATGAEYRRLPVADLEAYEGISVFYAAGPPEAQRCGATRVAVVGGGNSAAQAAIWLSRGGALVTLLHRRADLRETMSDYLIADLERYGIAVRDRSEITELHGTDGQLEEVTLSDGERLPLSFLFLFLGASPCTDWLGTAVARDDKGFVLTGPEAGAAEVLETSVPGVYAAGDVRSGSPKRCATAVGEGAAVVRLVHQRFSSVPA